jgi:hypothetical protein
VFSVFEKLTPKSLRIHKTVDVLTEGAPS